MFSQSWINPSYKWMMCSFSPFISYVKGYYSFGLVETNLFDRAEKVAREVNCLLLVLKGLRILRQGDGFCQLLVKVAKR